MSWLSELASIASDLVAWQEETGQSLPDGWTAEQIAEAELNGNVVDLETGELLPGEADARYTNVELGHEACGVRIVC